jgi:uncharacterized UBP type Zn finger protein
VARDRHLDLVNVVRPSTHDGCEDCLRIGSTWQQLRICLSCGHVGCCDGSPHSHARRHAFGVDHPIVQSYEPGERWRWCYFDDRYV